MHKFNSKIPTLFLLFFLFFPTTYSQNKIKTIVVFFSLGPNLPSYQNFLEGFKSSLALNTDESANLIIEYLDLSRTDDELYAKHIIEMYNAKFKETPIDLLVTFGPAIYPELEKYGLEALKTAPLINIDLDLPNRRSSQSSGNPNSLDIVLKLKSNSTLRAAFDLFPDYNNVFVISGIAATDKFFTSQIENCRKEFEPLHNFSFISGLTMDSTIEYVKKIPANSIVIVTTYLLDNNNMPFSTPEVQNIISNNCKAPVFPVTDSFTKRSGGIGGYIASFVYMGREIGRISTEMLHGKKARDINVNENSFYQYIYDWEQLKRWNLLGSKAISPESIFYNEDFSFFYKYRWYIIGVVIFLVSQTVLIFYLIRLNRRQKEITLHRLETENMYRELIRMDRLAKMTELTASLSHELNQPLTAILYSAQAGKRFLKSDKLDAKQAEEIFDNIIEDDKRAGGIISSVRNLMKLETRQEEKLSLNSLILETIDIIATDAIRHRVKINMKLNLNNENIFVFGDKIQLQQVLMNLIRNAIVAMEKNEPVNKFIEIIMKLNKDSVTVSVRDSGPGINDTVKESLFKPFVTSHKTGFGIGLALSRSIIEKHNGAIWAENIPGSGAEFSFRLKIDNNG
jgi:signal transduction histidine kinase